MFHGTLTITSGHTPPPILKLEPGDVIVAQSPIGLNQKQMDHLGHGIKKLFPGHQVFVLINGIHLTAIRQSGLPAGDCNAAKEGQ
jgi:hypothetical protein